MWTLNRLHQSFSQSPAKQTAAVNNVNEEMENRSITSHSIDPPSLQLSVSVVYCNMEHIFVILAFVLSGKRTFNCVLTERKVNCFLVFKLWLIRYIPAECVCGCEYFCISADSDNSAHQELQYSVTGL